LKEVFPIPLSRTFRKKQSLKVLGILASIAAGEVVLNSARRLSRRV
jgi:hypothetical protein